MTLKHFLLLGHIITGLSALIFILCIIRIKTRSAIIRLIGFIFLTGAVVHAIVIGMMNYGFGRYVNVPQSLYFIIAFCLITFIYYHALGERNKLLFQSIAVAFGVFGLINLLFIQKLQINSYNNTISSALTIIFAVYYFYYLLVDLPTTAVQRLPMFWFNIAFLVYHGGTFMLVLFTDYLVNVLNNDLLLYWSFHNILNIIEHLIVIVGVWIDLRTSR